MRAFDEASLLASIREVQAALEGPPFQGVHARLKALDDTARAMNVDLCEFARVNAPEFLPYYYLLEGSDACDDPAIPAWIRDDVRVTYGSN